jgi:hypothetical protein
MEQKDLFIQEELEIRSVLEKYVELYNLQNPDKKISLDDLFINKCVNKPGAIGCYNKNNKWYIYHVDDRFNLLVNGPFSKTAIIVALAKMMYIPSKMVDLSFTDEEYKLYLRGEEPVEKFESRKL